jgi:chromosome segregation ATPase
MHTKILRLEDKVEGLMNQRTAFEKKQADTDQIIEELRREVVFLKTQRQQHHDKLDVCKRGVDDNARHAQTLEQRIKAIPGSLEPRFQHHITRIDKIESLVRSFGGQMKQHNVQVEQTAAAKSRDGSQYGQTSEQSGGKSQFG